MAEGEREREFRVAGRLAPYLFAIIIPGVAFAMIGHIGVVAGFSIIIVSAAIGVADFVWVYTPRLKWRQKMGPILLGAAGLIALGFAILWFTRLAASPAHPAVAQELPIASLPFVETVLSVEHHQHNNQWNVRPMVNVKNNTNSLIRYEIVRLRADVNGSTHGDATLVDKFGVVYPNSTAQIMYDRIDNIDVSSHFLEGSIDYLLKYTTVPPSVERVTGRRQFFRTGIDTNRKSHPIGSTSSQPLSAMPAENIVER